MFLKLIGRRLLKQSPRVPSLATRAFNSINMSKPKGDIPSFHLVNPKNIKLVKAFQVDGIGDVYFLRPKLIQKLEEILHLNPLALISAPPGFGKSALISMLMRSNPDFEYRIIHFTNPGSPYDILLDHGIDLKRKRCLISMADWSKPILFIIDDAQRKFEDIEFWNLLTKDLQNWASPKIRFLISTTENIPLTPETLANLTEFPSIGKTDLSLNLEESFAFLESPLGFSKSLKSFDALSKVVASDCGGNIAALRIAVAELNEFAKLNPRGKESLFVQYYYSNNILLYMDRCFIEKVQQPEDHNLQLFLLQLFFRPPGKGAKFESSISESDGEKLASLVRSGILLEDNEGNLGFASSLAKRYYCKSTGDRSEPDDIPASLNHFFRKVFSNVAYADLAQCSNGFNRDLLNGVFFAAIMQSTPADCSICPELSYLLEDTLEIHRNNEIHAFINGKLRWGIKLVVTDKYEDSDNLLDNANYDKIGMADHVRVLVVQSLEELDIHSVKRSKNHITAFFNPVTSSFKCIFGLAENPEIISDLNKHKVY
jgi:hypothetical protein